MNFFKQCSTAALLLLSLQSIAQKNNSQQDDSQFKRLYIGDTVPMKNILFNNVRNYSGGKAKLSDFKGKYIILDFWTKGCNSCIAAFPHMEELQNQFKDEVQVLLITKNSEKELTLLLKNSPNVKNTNLPMVMGDQVLATKLFPHGTVPFHVWLDKEGKVIATTFGDQANAENFKNLVLGKQLNLPVKNEILDEDLINEVMDQKKSLLKVAGGRFKEYLKYYAQIPTTKVGNVVQVAKLSLPELPYYSFFLNYIPGEMMNGYRGLVDCLLKDENGKAKGFRIGQYTVDQFYKAAYNAGDLKIITEDNAKLLYEDITDTTNSSRYEINNSYCYESCLPNYSFEDARMLLQQDLRRFFGMVGNIEERDVKSIILSRLNTKEEESLWAKKQLPKPLDANLIVRNITKKSYSLKNSTIRGFFTDLAIANRSVQDPVFFDETGFTSDEGDRTVEIHMDCGLKISAENIPHLQRALARYGLGLREEFRKMNVLVLKPVM